MIEVRRTTDLVWLSMAEAALRAEGVRCVVFDRAVSGAEGAISAFPMRLLVPEDEAAAAQAILAAIEGAHG